MIDLSKTEELTVMHWASGLGAGLLAGAALVAVAMLVEREIVKEGSSIFRSR